MVRWLISDQFRSDKIVYRRYAGLFFCCCVDSNDNELAYLEAIHLFVEVLGECRAFSTGILQMAVSEETWLTLKMLFSRTCVS
jgi:hypothetical protein